MIRRFASGVALLARGFGFWRRRPGAMVLGLVPAAIVFAVMVAALVALGISLPVSSSGRPRSPTAWDAFWANALRYADRVRDDHRRGPARGHHLHRAHPRGRRPVLRAHLACGRSSTSAARSPSRAPDSGGRAADAAGLVALGVVAALVVALVGFIPVVGGGRRAGARRDRFGLAARPRAHLARVRRPRHLGVPTAPRCLRGSRAQMLGLRRRHPALLHGAARRDRHDAGGGRRLDDARAGGLDAADAQAGASDTSATIGTSPRESPYRAQSSLMRNTATAPSRIEPANSGNADV